MGATRASTWDSPSIATFKTRVARKAGGNFERRRSRHSASNKGLSSWGGPGKSITMRSRPSNFPLGHSLAGKIVFSGPKAAAENHDLRPEQSVLRGRNQTLEIVADHTLENYFNAQLVDLLGEKKRVCIHAVGSQ